MRSLILIAELLAVPAAARDNPVGYLPPTQVKGLLRQIPEPPAPGSAADKADRERYAQAEGGTGNAAWQWAIGQISVNASRYRKQMSCALGVTVGPKTTPGAAAVLARAATDPRFAVGLAKDFFQREHPFTTDAGRTCDRQSAKNNAVRLGYAYPSGHTTIWMLWGLIVADMMPVLRAHALAFGKEAGDLRAACLVHWHSDIIDAATGKQALQAASRPAGIPRRCDPSAGRARHLAKPERLLTAPGLKMSVALAGLVRLHLHAKRIGFPMRRLLAAALLAAVPAAAQPAPQATMQSPAASPLPGYVAEKPELTLLRLLPPPPEPGSSEERADRFQYRESRRGVGGPQWRAAIGQLSVTSPSFLKAMSCALGAELGPQTPATLILLRRAGTDLARGVSAAKNYYKRSRPFASDRGKACDPDAAVDGGKALGFAYPSGHSAVGWLWGLILSDARPSRSAELLKFGKATGDLRVACRVHWASDINGGRLLATALYQRIADSSDYKTDLARARTELSLVAVPEGCPAA